MCAIYRYVGLFKHSLLQEVIDIYSHILLLFKYPIDLYVYLSTHQNISFTRLHCIFYVKCAYENFLFCWLNWRNFKIILFENKLSEFIYKISILFHSRIQMVDFQSHYRVFAHGLTPEPARIGVKTHRELYHEEGRKIFRLRHDRPGITHFTFNKILYLIN